MLTYNKIGKIRNFVILFSRNSRIVNFIKLHSFKIPSKSHSDHEQIKRRTLKGFISLLGSPGGPPLHLRGLQGIDDLNGRYMSDGRRWKQRASRHAHELPDEDIKITARATTIQNVEQRGAR